jgi:hypothetical protein
MCIREGRWLCMRVRIRKIWFIKERNSDTHAARFRPPFGRWTDIDTFKSFRSCQALKPSRFTIPCFQNAIDKILKSIELHLVDEVNKKENLKISRKHISKKAYILDVGASHNSLVSKHKINRK